MEAPKIDMFVERDSVFPRYIEDMSEQLKSLVPGEVYKELRYLLDMVKLAARQSAKEIEEGGRRDTKE